MDELKSLPLPPISGANNDVQYSVSNIALTFYDLLPEDIEIKVQNRLSDRLIEVSNFIISFCAEQVEDAHAPQQLLDARWELDR